MLFMQAKTRNVSVTNVCSAQLVVQAHSVVAGQVASQAITVAYGAAIGQNCPAHIPPPVPLPPPVPAPPPPPPYLAGKH